MEHLRVIIRSTGVAVVFILAISGSSFAGNGFRGDLTFGYDSFVDRFTILEEDTTDAIQEFYLSLTTSLTHTGGKFKTGATNTFRYGTQSINEIFYGNLSAGSWESIRLEIRNSSRLKFYRDGSDYEFGNDYVQSNTSIKLGRAIRENLKISARGRMEIIDYSEKTSFDYDYLYFDGGLEVESGSYFERFARVAVSAGHREVADTTDLSYDRILTGLEFHFQPAPGTLAEFSISGDRRDYRGESRSPLWNVYSFSSISIPMAAGMKTSLRFDSESYIYDRPSTTFFDTHYLRGGIKTTIPVNSAFSLFAEPRFARMLCDEFEEEKYWEGSVVLGLDLLGSGDYWCTFSWEPGRRDYIMEKNEIYSDFYLNRLSLMGSIKTPNDFSIGLFIMHDPERHSRRDDDFSLTMISATISKEF
ncbi:MAG: hypothetical protein KOO63_15060 [Bacteroidales bacterium]|nr:hypothetical protein [Candidatus Latescibacterota bacterium]